MIRKPPNRCKIWSCKTMERDEDGEWRWAETRECKSLPKLVWSGRPRWLLCVPWSWRVWWRVKSPWGRRALAREIASFDA